MAINIVEKVQIKTLNDNYEFGNIRHFFDIEFGGLF